MNPQLKGLLEKARELQRREDYVGAKDIGYQALELAESIYGNEHPQLIAPLLEVAFVVGRQDRSGVAHAGDLLERTLRIAHSAFGMDDPRLIRILTRVGWVLRTQASYQEALEHYRRAIEISDQVYGESSQQVMPIWEIVNLYLLMGRPAEALPYAERILTISERDELPRFRSGPVISANLLRRCLRPLGRNAEALLYVERALSRILAINPTPNVVPLSELRAWIEEPRKEEAQYDNELIPLVDEELNNLLRNGRELWDSGDLIEIEAAFRRALELAESRGGPEAPETIFPLRELATVVACIPDRFPEALDLLRRALHIAETHFGPDDPRLIDLLSYLGTKLWTFRAYDEAAEHYRRALTISERSHGDGGMTAYLLTNLASILLEAGSTQDALPLAERALRIEEAKQNPPSDCGIVAAILVVRRCLLALEKKPEALAHCERVLALYEPRHPEPDNRVVRELKRWIEELRQPED